MDYDMEHRLAFSDGIVWELIQRFFQLQLEGDDLIVAIRDRCKDLDKLGRPEVAQAVRGWLKDVTFGYAEYIR